MAGRREYRLPHADAASWGAVNESLLPLLSTPLTFAHLEQAIAGSSAVSVRLPGLERAAELCRQRLEPVPNERWFLDTLVPAVVLAALDAPSLFPVPSLPLLCGKDDHDEVVELSRCQIRCLLALSFFDALRYPGGSSGNLSFFGLYLDPLNGVGTARVACQLAYLDRVCVGGPSPDSLPPLPGMIRIVRQKRRALPDFANLHDVFILGVDFTAETRIEDAAGCAAHMDFANKFLHIGRVIPSATQEEVLFSVRPELFAAALVAGGCAMTDNEAIVISGAFRYAKYTGYLGSFRFAGVAVPYSEALPPPDVIAVDATIVGGGRSQFSAAAVNRDTGKFWLGVLGLPRGSAVSTGNWGCGAFGGNVCLKLLQQLMAAAVAGVELRYSAFGDAALAARLAKLAALVRRRSVAEVHAACLAFGQNDGDGGDRLMTVAKACGVRCVEAVRDMRSAQAEEEAASAAALTAEDRQEKLRNATSLYRRAFRAWPALDSPLAADGIPERVLSEASFDLKCAELTTQQQVMGQDELAPYLSGSYEAMERRATEIGVSAFEIHLHAALA